MSIPFNRDYPFEYATVERIAPGLRRVVARNPSPFTFHGTATFIVGEGEVAVIDPGPADPAHVETLIHALEDETVSHILVTHTHRDHSPAAARLKQVTGAETYAFGPHGAGKLEHGAQVEEGGDLHFVPDVRVRDAEVLYGDGFSFECVYTPGHTSNHMCYAHRETATLFTGDHVMGWNTSIIAPPDGDMGDYLASLEKLLARDDRLYRPTHGPAIEHPKPFVRAYIAHRRAREKQVLACLGDGKHRIHAMLPSIYAHLPETMHPAAARSLFATLIHLVERGLVRVDGPLAIDAHFERVRTA